MNNFQNPAIIIPGGSSAVLISETLTANGEYVASDYNADGFSIVEVAVPSAPSFEGKFHGMITRTISEITPEDLQGINQIGSFAFYTCGSLTSVHIPSNFVRLDYASFSGCSQLATVVIDDLTGSMVIGGNSFASCPALTSIIIGSGVWYIDGYCFYQSGLLSIDLPSTVSNIGEAVFVGCYSLTQATIRSTTPPTLQNSNSFDGSYPIYVPAESVEAYKSATNWSALTDRIQAIPT